jgi:hypothetical protein
MCLLLLGSKLPKHVIEYLYEWIFCSFCCQLLHGIPGLPQATIAAITDSTVLLRAAYENGFQYLEYNVNSGSVLVSFHVPKKLTIKYKNAKDITRFSILWKKNGQLFSSNGPCSDLRYSLELQNVYRSKRWKLPPRRIYVPLSDGRLAILYPNGRLEIWK